MKALLKSRTSVSFHVECISCSNELFEGAVTIGLRSLLLSPHSEGWFVIDSHKSVGPDKCLSLHPVIIILFSISFFRAPLTPGWPPMPPPPVLKPKASLSKLATRNIFFHFLTALTPSRVFAFFFEVAAIA